MTNQDKKLINACTEKDVLKLFEEFSCEHPMDNDIIEELKSLESQIPSEGDDYIIFKCRKQTDTLWGLLLEKSIKCLRYYDDREPFQNSGKKKMPKAYGIDELKEYYDKYGKFEKILYGSNRYYRDHVIHVFRTWLSGVYLLTKNNGAYLNKITINEKKSELNLNKIEKLSMWTIIALTHDLGYPLEKAKSIIDVTQDMVSTFITNPDISVDFSFHGVQNYMNDFIIRLMSSKMEHRPKQNTSGEEEQDSYVARLQSKYYFKFQKSLEQNKHGILSTLIIYKLLTYFLESDYNINEDYTFDKEERRQFYIRREILRAIASHTCDDVYQLYMGSFSFLLRICDDTQEWGRKNISELYVNSPQKYKLHDIALDFSSTLNQCTIEEEMWVQDVDSTLTLVHRFREQAIVYVTIFRDGQDTISRDFSFIRKLTVNVEEIKVTLTLEVHKDEASKLSGIIKYTSDRTKNNPFGKEFISNLPRYCTWAILDGNDTPVSSYENEDMSAPEKWNRCEFAIPLTN